MTDDILVYGRTKEEHHRNLMRVLQILEKSGLTLNVDKCNLYKESVTFFGIKFSKDGISPTEGRCQALRNASPPTNAKELKSLLAVFQWSSQFIKGYEKITAPLGALLRVGFEWNWSEVESAAFEDLKSGVSDKAMAFFNREWSSKRGACSGMGLREAVAIFVWK